MLDRTGVTSYVKSSITYLQRGDSRDVSRDFFNLVIRGLLGDQISLFWKIVPLCTDCEQTQLEQGIAC
jgi:hypothetical protein